MSHEDRTPASVGAGRTSAPKRPAVRPTALSPSGSRPASESSGSPCRRFVMERSIPPRWSVVRGAESTALGLGRDVRARSVYRKVTKITEELCGCEISSSDVSRATALLDEDLQKMAQPPAGTLQIPNPRRPLREDPPRRLPRGLCRIDGDWRRSRRSPQRLGRERFTLRSGGSLAEFFKSLLGRGLHGVVLIRAMRMPA